MSCVFQNLAGLQNRYPQNLWQEILGNADVQLFLGCTDPLTAEFVAFAEGEMYEEQPGEFREETDTAGEDIYITGEDSEPIVMEAASGLAENTIEPEDAPTEGPVGEPITAKPKRSLRKKKTVPAKEEDEAETIREQGDREEEYQKEPEEELLVEEPLPIGNNESELQESHLDIDADYSDDLAIDSAETEDVDEWEGALSENEEKIAERTVDEIIEEAADKALPVGKRKTMPSPASEKRTVDSAPRRTAIGKRERPC